MTLTIIGGSGFIGSRLCERLQRDGKTDFLVLDKKTSQFAADKTKICDIVKIEDIEATLPYGATIVHLAAEHRDDVRPLSLYDDVNVNGTANICSVARTRDVKRIVFTSTVAIYGYAKIGTDENGAAAPFNDYGRTKFEAEAILKQWQSEAPNERCLVIIRPTVVFGERNRGNVYNLLKQIASGRFLMIGAGTNRKSLAYVENVAAFIEYSLQMPAGVHVFNYVDKPDFNMNTFVGLVQTLMGRKSKVGIRVPKPIGLAGGFLADVLSRIIGKSLPISQIRVRKFCANSVYNTAAFDTGFKPPVALEVALQNTVRFEFLNKNSDGRTFQTE